MSVMSRQLSGDLDSCEDQHTSKLGELTLQSLTGSQPGTY